MKQFPNIIATAENSGTDAVDRTNDGTIALGFFGCLLIVAGIIATIYFAAEYDTTMETTVPGAYLSSIDERLPDTHQRVTNIGLEENRLIGVLCGLASCLLGMGLLILAKLNAAHIDMKRNADAVEATGEIVARQDMEWRKKAETPEPEERRDT